MVRALVTSKFEPNLLERVSFLEPQDFPTFLEHLEAQGSSKEELVRGYKVKVNYRTMEPEEKKSRRQTVSQVILEALRRLKGKDS